MVQPSAATWLRSIGAICAIGALCSACASAPAGPTSRPAIATAVDACDVSVLLVAPASSEGLREAVIDALPSACEVLASWDLAPQTLETIVVHADVERFVAATGQTSDTLRAWTTPSVTHLLVGPTAFDNAPGRVRRRLTHELCHAALWSRGAQAAKRRAPRALEEGICSVVADQGDERGGRDDVVRALRAGRVVDFESDAAFSYAYAHHVVDAVARCRGRRGLIAAYDAVVAGIPLVDALGGAPAVLVREGCDADQERAPAPP